MQITKLILKSILIYTSIFFWIIFISGVESIIEQHYFSLFLIIGLIDILLLKLFISSDDLDILFFNITLKEYEENNRRKKGKYISGINKNA